MIIVQHLNKGWRDESSRSFYLTKDIAVIDSDVGKRGSDRGPFECGYC